MKSLRKKSFLAVLLSLSLIAGSAFSTLGALAADEDTTGKDLVVVDPMTDKGIGTVEQVNDTHKVPLSSKANASLTGGMSGAPTTGTSLYMTTSSEGKSGILKSLGDLDITAIKNGEQYTLDAWVWISDASKCSPFVIRLFDKDPVADGNQDRIGDPIYQWNSAQGVDSTTTATADNKIQNGWNHITAPITGITSSTLKYVAVYNHGASQYDIAVASVSLKKVAVQSEFTLFTPSESALSSCEPKAIITGSESTTDFVQVNPNEGASTAITSVATGSLTGGDAGAPTTGNAIKLSIPAGKQTGIRKSIELPTGNYNVVEAWVWVEDAAAAGMNLVMRLYTGEPSQHASGGYVGNENGFNKGTTGDIDEVAYGTQKLQNGWNRLVYYVPAIANKTYKYITIYNHTTNTTKNINVAIASVSLIGENINEEKGAVRQSLYRTNSANISVKPISEIGTAVDGLPTGNAYYGTINTGLKSGIGFENLNQDVSNVKQIASGAGTTAALDFWFYAEAQPKQLIFALQEANLTDNGQGYFTESWNTRALFTDQVNVGWNHVVLTLPDSLLTQTARPVEIDKLMAVTVFDNQAHLAGSYHFAITGVTLKLANDGADMELITGEDNVILASTNKNAPAGVAVKNNADLTGGAEGAPTTGTAYYATIDNTARAGIAVENLDFDASNVVDKNRKAGDLYRFDAWVWIEDIDKVGNFVFRFYPDNLPASPTNGSWIEGWMWQFGSADDIDSTQEGKQTFQTGWNHVVKDVAEMGTNKAAFSLKTVSVHDHRNIGNKDTGYSFALASVELKKVGEVEKSDAMVEYEKVESGLNYNCDTIDATKYNYSYKTSDELAAHLSVDETDKKEGAGSLSFTRVEGSKLLMHINNPVTATSNDAVPSYKIEDMDNCYFGFWFYCDNPAAINRLALEFSSDATGTDKEEWEWNLTGQVIYKGWNQIVVSLKNAPAVIGEFDKDNIRRWRIFCLANDDTTPVNIKVDDISVLKVKQHMEQTAEKGLDDNCDAINNDKYSYKPAVCR